MSAHDKLAEIIEYASERMPTIVLDKKWNKLIRDMIKELEMLEDTTRHNAEKSNEHAHVFVNDICACGATWQQTHGEIRPR